MKNRATCGALGVGLLLLWGGQPVFGGEITGVNWLSGVASVAGTFFAPPSAPGNDDAVGTSPNSIFVTQKDYFAIGPVDLVFDVVDNGGTTEYLVREGVQNGTGEDWIGYHLELGFGEGTSFIKSSPADGLDFDSPDFNSDLFFNPTPGAFPLVLATEDDIIASGGIQPDFSFRGEYLFHVDVPDGITEFTIRQSPIPASANAVPEPGMLTTVLLCCLCLGLWWKIERVRSGNGQANGGQMS